MTEGTALPSGRAGALARARVSSRTSLLEGAGGGENAPRLCILTQYFPPEIGAPQGRLSELGEQLVDLGWRVEALTALPNYPAGRVFDGYNQTRPVVERIGRIRTARVPLYPSQEGFVRRVACYLSFAASASGLGPRYCPRPDLIWVESPPLFIGIAARALSWRWRCPYVFNVSDLWPENAVEMGVLDPGILASAAERFELSTYRGAAGVTGQSQEIVDSIVRRAPGVQATLITNGVDTDRFGADGSDRQELRALLGDADGPIFVYAGLFGHPQGLDQILDLAAELPSDVPGRFVLVGDGPVRRSLEQRIAAESIGRVRLVPPIPRERIPALLAGADAAVVSLRQTLRGAVPSKLYEAMAARLPILLVAEGEPARRVEEAGCGLVSAPGDGAALRANFERLAREPDLRARLGAAGRRAAETTYDRRRIAERLDAFLRSRLAPAPVYTGSSTR
ncbi:glycosyltransferase family 4 protein [soil metagenome]